MFPLAQVVVVGSGTSSSTYNAESPKIIKIKTMKRPFSDNTFISIGGGILSSLLYINL